MKTACPFLWKLTLNIHSNKHDGCFGHCPSSWVVSSTFLEPGYVSAIWCKGEETPIQLDLLERLSLNHWTWWWIQIQLPKNSRQWTMSKLIFMITVILMEPVDLYWGHGRKPHGSGSFISIPFSSYFPMFSSSYIAILTAGILVMVKTVIIH